jgi:hypothetical protein
MTQARDLHPVLLVGGSGVVGRVAASTLRRFQPELSLLIGGRDLPKAEALAREVGRAQAISVDLMRADLAVAGPVSAVVTLLKDDTLNALKFAQQRGVPLIAFSNWSFDIAPEIAQFAHRPAAAPVLLLGHVLGGTMIASTLHVARGLRAVRAIEIGIVVDSDDGGGPATAGDFDRITQNVPRPLLLCAGKWLWAGEELANRTFVDAVGVERRGQALPLLDVPSLAAATRASSVRVDFAIRDAATRPAGVGPAHSVSIEIEGEDHSGRAGRFRYALLGEGGHSTTSAYGAALAIERVLGLAGGEPLVPGLYQADGVLDPGVTVARLRELGVRIQGG